MKISDLYSNSMVSSPGGAVQRTSKSSLQESQSSVSGSNNAYSSSLLKFAYSRNITELTYSNDETIIGYRKDNSMALRAHSTTNINMRQESISVEATFSAESLGLSADCFGEDGKTPIQFSMAFSMSDFQLNYKSSAKVVQTTRSVDEILQDLGSALGNALRGKGQIRLNLDDEALRSIFADEKIAKLYMEIVSLVAMVNSMKKMNEDSEDQEINISGKGKPYLDYEEQLSIDSKESLIEFKFTILPPGSAQEQISSSQDSVETPAAVEQPVVDMVA
jgi:hypothetical protein